MDRSALERSPCGGEGHGCALRVGCEPAASRCAQRRSGEAAGPHSIACFALCPGPSTASSSLLRRSSCSDRALELSSVLSSPEQVCSSSRITCEAGQETAALSFLLNDSNHIKTNDAMAPTSTTVRASCHPRISDTVSVRKSFLLSSKLSSYTRKYNTDVDMTKDELLELPRTALSPVVSWGFLHNNHRRSRGAAPGCVAHGKSILQGMGSRRRSACAVTMRAGPTNTQSSLTMTRSTYIRIFTKR
jgi:hypothetical protein